MGYQDLTGQVLGAYELRACIGAGGMGVVYRAYQRSLGREVALKVLTKQFANDTTYIERFDREARVAAALEHAHIVPVYDYGVEDDLSYVVMRLLTGGTLTQRIHARAETDKPLPSLGEVAELLRQLGSALDYAHGKGVIHRDIKPSNVMFDHQGNAYLVDFGIAKLLDATKPLTASGVVMGTPAYIAPEQWKGEPLSPATDQYALAVMTYALVTGRTPFEAETPNAMMYKHLDKRPTPVDMLRPDVPEEVAAVLDRALAKRPDARFPNCTAFAQAFDSAIRGNTGETTGFFTTKLKQPPATSTLTPSGERISGSYSTTPQDKVRRKERQLWGAVAALVLLIAGGLFAFGRGKGKTLSATDIAYTQSAVAAAQTDTPSPVPTQPAIVILRSDTPTATATHTPLPTSTATPSLAPSATHTLDFREAARATHDAILTATATHWTPTPTATHTPTVDVQGTINAELTALYYNDLTITATLRTNTPTPTLTPTSTYTPRADRTRAEQLAVLEGHTDKVLSVAWSPDGIRLASAGADGTVRLWNTLSGQPLATLQEHTYHVYSVAWSPDGARLASAGADGTVRLWDAQSGQQLAALQGHTDEVRSVAWSPDGQRLASASWDGTMRLWDAQSGQPLATLQGHTSAVYSVDWSPDGARLASASRDGTVRLWDAQSGQQLATLYGHTDEVLSVAWSPDGTRLASASRDGTVRLWDAQSGQQLAALQRHTDWVWSVAWSPDGIRLVSASTDGTARLWNAQSGQQLAILQGHMGSVRSVAWSSDKTRIASAGADHTVRIWGVQ